MWAAVYHYFFNKSKWNFNSTSMIHPAQGVQKENHRKVIIESKCQKKNSGTKSTKKKKNISKLHLNTHTKSWMFPPIRKAITKGSFLRFQP